uniref:Glucuronosyltransferase n=1 Tax=Meloidogyne hapla TaxID=6305 RepID=A0A1I8C2C7_MELHA
MYAAVPLICIPDENPNDQKYNTAIVENLGLGIWVERENIAEQIFEAMYKVLHEYFPEHEKQYEIDTSINFIENAQKHKDKIRHQESQRTKFLRNVEYVINN